MTQWTGFNLDVGFTARCILMTARRTKWSFFLRGYVVPGNARGMVKRCLAHLAFCSLLVLLPNIAQAKMSHNELNTAWRDLIKTDWLIEENKFPFQHCFEQSAMANKIPLALLLSIARGESSFNPSAVSKANAIGIMQIQWPGTAKHLQVQQKNELFEPCPNIEYGARYLKQLLKKYNNNIHMTLAAYNYGPSRIAAHSGHLPSGALWYSEYILNHHDHVMNRAYITTGDYEQLQAITVLTFNQPYRAQAMMEYLQGQYKMFKFDWFLSSETSSKEESFRVRVLVSSQYEEVLAKRQLSVLGFEL